MNVTVSSISKVDGQNAVTVSMDLSPKNIVHYDTADWLSAFQGIPYGLNAVEAVFDKETGKLRITFSYSQHLQGESINLNSNLSLASSAFNLSSVSISFPQQTSNNQALYLYDDSTYFIAAMVKYVSYIVAATSVLMFAVGYFGCKLQSIEGIAVVQVSALLLMTL
jgi:hypothetical protein